MKNLALLFSAVLFMNGCASINANNYASPKLTAGEMQTIAIDGSTIMADTYPPGKTTLRIKDGGTFGKLFTEALRKRGFAVQETDGMTLNYLVDPVDANTIRLGLVTPNWRGDALYLRKGNTTVRLNLTQRID